MDYRIIPKQREQTRPGSCRNASLNQIFLSSDVEFLSSLHEGRPNPKRVGGEFDIPEGHECMVADLAVLCRREQRSQNSGPPMMERRVAPYLSEGLGKHRKISLITSFLLLNVLVS